MEYSKNWLGQFKHDYFYHGKFNLDVQVPHLARLAEFYLRKYRRFSDWTDCVKAHALYNSISCRMPDFLGWKKQVFSVQQEYLGESSSFTLEKQEKLTVSLKKDLEAIRNRSRDHMKPVHALVNEFESDDKGEDNSKTLFSKMKTISLECSDCMAEFSSRIIRESIEILKPAKPPCYFEVVAMGSLARGEATPYSDLEYLFLIEDKSPETVEYFKKLAVTTYFQIANLGETKLSYMVVKELDGWFVDKAMNGFKIDGLSEQAGNIPTGNGSQEQRNQFIVTLEELVAKYQDVLDNPQEETALRGDITSMLTYLKLIFTPNTGNSYLLRKLQESIQNLSVKQKRQDINLKMLNSDVRKFNFVPNYDLHKKGYAADVKKEIYRFPSILLLDIAVLTNTAAKNSWESLIALCDKKHISTQLKSVLEILLASATYMRLSAYLFHDSQDDRMSVSPVIWQSQQATDRQLSKAQQRWFVCQGLFIATCVKLILLKEQLAKTKNTAIDLQTLALDDDDTWPRITTLYYSGRDREALVALKDLYGDSLCDDPLSVIQKIQSGKSECDALYYISEILFMCDEDKAALLLYKHMTDNNIWDENQRIGDCYRRLGDYNKAVTTLESITDKSAMVYYSLGHAYYGQKEYKRSENAYLQALELWYADISSEKQEDYYGNPIDTNDQPNTQKVTFMTITSAEDRLSRIIYSSASVILCVTSLGDVNRRQGKHKVAESYYQKSLHLVSELYGKGAAIISAAIALNNLGDNYNMIGQYSDAEDYYKQALAIYQKISPDGVSSDIARTLNNLGDNYNQMGQYSDAEGNYKQALAIYQKISPDRGGSDIAYTMNNLGDNYNEMGKYSDAEYYYRQALAIYQKISPDGGSSDIAYTLNNLGFNYRMMGDNYNMIGQYSDAEDYYKHALAIYQKISPDEGSSDIARTLNNLGDNYNEMGQYRDAEGNYKQALAIYQKISPDRGGIDIAYTMNNLGFNYSRMGKYSDAAYYYRQALAIYQKISPDGGSSDIAQTLNNLGFNSRRMGQYSDAVDYYKQALAIYQKISSDGGSSDIAQTLDKLALNYGMMGQYSDAVDYFKQALAIYQKISPDESSSDIANTLNNLGDNYGMMGQYSDAVDYYTQVLAIYQKISPNEGSSDIANTLYNLGNIYRAAGDECKALETHRQALDMYSRVDLKNHKVRGVCSYLSEASNRALASSAKRLCRQGETRYHKKKYTQAERYYKKALDVYIALSTGPDSISIALTMCNLACVYVDTREKDKAVETLREALDMYIRLDPANKQISRIRLYLTFYTGSSCVTDSPATDITSYSDTQTTTSVPSTSSDTNT